MNKKLYKKKNPGMAIKKGAGMPGLKARDIEELRDGNCKFHCSVNKNPTNPG
jgi:hypothetical protein